MKIECFACDEAIEAADAEAIANRFVAMPRSATARADRAARGDAPD